MAVVNDGSIDRTLEELKKWPTRPGLKIISYDLNRGKGYAIKQGMLQAKGKYRLFMDIDLSTPLEAFHQFCPRLGNTDIIIGTRKTDVGQIIERQPWWRGTPGKGFTLLSRLILKVKASDFTCGFKCFSEKAATAIFPRLTIERWGFDAEILFLTKKLGFFLLEVGVLWRNDPHTKFNLKHDVLRSLADLIQIRLNDWPRLY